MRLETPLAGAKVTDADGTEIPVLVEDDGHSVSWRADGVGSLGWRSYRLTKARKKAGWTATDGVEIANEHHRLRVDPPAAAGGVAGRGVRRP